VTCEQTGKKLLLQPKYEQQQQRSCLPLTESSFLPTTCLAIKDAIMQQDDGRYHR